MNYQHSYHAGNFADVFKHSLQLVLLQSLLKKPTPFCYLESHAGVGKYDLQSNAAKHTQEFVAGIEKIYAHENPPELIANYLAIVKKLNTTNLRIYPGSPYYAQQLLRRGDRMILAELQRDAFIQLKKNFPHDRKIQFFQRDGYQNLQAVLPPIERRGLILIDPPYENDAELASIPAQLAQCLQRFETGIYAVWYPIKHQAAIKQFYRALSTTLNRPYLTTEFCIYPTDIDNRLNGCGMIVVNPPWQFEQEFGPVLQWLWENLSPKRQGHASIKMNIA
jgi:23S rRNA (adenine2030-N6)-methyltransferase